MGIKENLEKIHQEIKEACQRSNREVESVTLVHVSKTKPIELLEEGYQAGMRLFGENKVQELRDKYVHFNPEGITWHMIGHLQRNKVKYIVDKVALIHSVDSLRLAKTINLEASKQKRQVAILLQVNIAEEESKYGFKKEEVESVIRELVSYQHIQIKGLMTLAPFVDNPENNRFVFKQLRELMVDINRKNIDNISMCVLSMGMTNDYQIAIEEGATMIRIGTALFGKRVYMKG